MKKSSKTSIVLLIILLVLAGSLISSCKKRMDQNQAQSTPIPPPTQTTQATTAEPETETETESDSETPYISEFTISTGDENEYYDYETITLNSGKDIEVSRLGYFFAPGVYDIENIGESPAQISIYNSEIITNEDGIEENESKFSELVDAGKTVHVIIEKDDYISLQDGDILSVKAISFTINKKNQIETYISFFTSDLENGEIAYDEETNTYLVSFWKNGYSDACINKNSDWKSVAQGTEGLCNDLLNSIKKTDDSAHLAFFVRNDQNTDNFLLVVEDGEIVYDASTE